jgi:hypothetical protein
MTFLPFPVARRVLLENDFANSKSDIADINNTPPPERTQRKILDCKVTPMGINDSIADKLLLEIIVLKSFATFSASDPEVNMRFTFQKQQHTSVASVRLALSN